MVSVLLNDVTSPSAAPFFDECARTNDSEPRISEDAYSYLNRLAGDEGSRIRSMLEDWFAHYDADDDEKERLREAFIDKKEGIHLGAWWELYTYSLYRCLGYRIEVHPKLDGVDTTPDFLLTRGAESMYVECTVVSALDGPVTKRLAVEAAICDAIREIDQDDWLIGVTFNTDESNETPSLKKITADIGNWLKEYDPNKVWADIEAARACGEEVVIPKKDFTFRDWSLTCIAYPKPPDDPQPGRRWLGALPPSGKFDFSKITKRIRDAVRDKGGKYGDRGTLDKPLVVAVMSVNRIASIGDAIDAMFGSRTRDQGRRDGYWRAPGSDGSARGARVSAVLFSHDMQPWSVASHLPVALINPWADQPINDHPPLSTITATGEGEMLEKQSPTTPRDVFGSDI